MKKSLLRIGYFLCFFLSLFFIEWTIGCAKLGSVEFLFSLFPTAGPILGTIALWNELKDKRSKKILTALCIWTGLFAVFWLLVFISSL